MVSSSPWTTSKSKTIRTLAKQMNKLCKNTLLYPIASVGQLFSLATTCSTTGILDQELKTLIAPDRCSDWRCMSCVECQVCAPPEKMSARVQLQKEKMNRNHTLAEHVSIAIDKLGKRRIVVSLPGRMRRGSGRSWLAPFGSSCRGSWLGCR